MLYKNTIQYHCVTKLVFRVCTTQQNILPNKKLGRPPGLLSAFDTEFAPAVDKPQRPLGLTTEI